MIMSEVRGSGREYQTATVQERPRGAIPHRRSGGAADRRYPASEVRGGHWEELPMPRRPRPGVEARRSNPTPKARGGGREDQPHVQGAMAVQVQEGLEELSNVETQEGRW